GYPDLAYARALHQGRLPLNVEVNEFFFLAGQWLGSSIAQQNYIAANYTHALQYLLAKGVNVVAQLVAKRVVDGKPRYSLGGNTDTTIDLLAARRAGKAAFQMYGEVNSEMPFMPGDGDLAADDFAGVLDDLAPFQTGLYGVSEMFFEAFLALIDANIIRREVDGALLHAAFFLGPKAFYRRLREMPPDQLNRIQMKAVSFTNEIYDEEAAK